MACMLACAVPTGALLLCWQPCLCLHAVLPGAHMLAVYHEPPALDARAHDITVHIRPKDPVPLSTQLCLSGLPGTP